MPIEVNHARVSYEVQWDTKRWKTRLVCEACRRVLERVWYFSCALDIVKTDVELPTGLRCKNATVEHARE